LKVLGREDLIGDPNYETPKARGERIAEVNAMVADWTRRRDKHEAMRTIGAAGVPAGAVLDTMELMNEPSFTERGILQTVGTFVRSLQDAVLARALRRPPAEARTGSIAGTAQRRGLWRMARDERG